MPPSASIAASRRPASAGWVAGACKAAGAVIVALAAALYLSGFFFLWSMHLDPRAASPLTVLRFAYYYGSWPRVHGALVRACVGGAGAVLLSGLVLLLPRRRPLHGEARFATRREIAGAGLLGERGIILGRLGRRCLMLAGQQGVVLAAPTNVVFAGPNLDTLIVPNLGRWHLTRGDLGVRGTPLFYPTHDQLGS